MMEKFVSYYELEQENVGRKTENKINTETLQTYVSIQVEVCTSIGIAQSVQQLDGQPRLASK
jgi:hypothetical protein